MNEEDFKEVFNLECELEFDISQFPFKELYQADGKRYTGVGMSLEEEENLYKMFRAFYRLYYKKDFNEGGKNERRKQV